MLVWNPSIFTSGRVVEMCEVQQRTDHGGFYARRLGAMARGNGAAAAARGQGRSAAPLLPLIRPSASICLHLPPYCPSPPPPPPPHTHPTPDPPDAKCDAHPPGRLITHMPNGRGFDTLQESGKGKKRLGVGGGQGGVAYRLSLLSRARASRT